MGYITTNRVLIEAVQKAAELYDLKYTAFSDNWIIRLEKGDMVQFIFGYFIDCNAQAASAVASDKVATYLLLEDAGLAAVPHYMLKSAIMPSLDASLLQEMLATYHDLVVKPLKGSRGSGVTRHTDVDTVISSVNTSPEDTWAISPYVEVQCEMRLVVFKSEVLLAYEKTDPQEINGLPMYNLEHGAQPQDISLPELSEEWRRLAIDAMEAIGLTFGAVDIIIDAKGKAQVLEINSGFSLEHYALTSVERRQAALKVYLHVFRYTFV